MTQSNVLFQKNLALQVFFGVPLYHIFERNRNAHFTTFSHTHIT